MADWSAQRHDWPVASPLAFNHVIIYLPEFDLYANPTQKTAPFGILDDDLRNKLVLRMGPHPVATSTPRLQSQDKHLSAEGKVVIAGNGTLSGSTMIKMSPLMAIKARRRFSGEAAEQLKSALARLPYGGAGTVKTSDVEDRDTPFTIAADWSAPQAIRLNAVGFIAPGLPHLGPGSSLRGVLNDNKPRRYPITLSPLDVKVHYTITVPSGYALQAPPTIRVANSVGSYTETYTPKSHGLVVDQRLSIVTRGVPAARYGQVKQIAHALANSRSAIIGLSTRP